jgi:hypothetical protein
MSSRAPARLVRVAVVDAAAATAAGLLALWTSYIFTADGSSSTFFFKLGLGVTVDGVLK